MRKTYIIAALLICISALTACGNKEMLISADSQEKTSTAEEETAVPALKQETPVQETSTPTSLQETSMQETPAQETLLSEENIVNRFDADWNCDGKADELVIFRGEYYSGYVAAYIPDTAEDARIISVRDDGFLYEDAKMIDDSVIIILKSNGVGELRHFYVVSYDADSDSITSLSYKEEPCKLEARDGYIAIVNMDGNMISCDTSIYSEEYAANGIYTEDGVLTEYGRGRKLVNTNGYSSVSIDGNVVRTSRTISVFALWDEVGSINAEYYVEDGRAVRRNLSFSAGYHYVTPLLTP